MQYATRSLVMTDPCEEGGRECEGAQVAQVATTALLKRLHFCFVACLNGTWLGMCLCCERK